LRLSPEGSFLKGDYMGTFFAPTYRKIHAKLI
jgi:hypothetical protein